MRAPASGDPTACARAPLAEDHPRPMRLGRSPQEGQLPPGPVPSPARTTRRQESHRRRRRLHSHRYLPHADQRNPLRGSRSRPFRPSRQSRPHQAPRRQASEPRIRRRTHSPRRVTVVPFLSRNNPTSLPTTRAIPCPKSPTVSWTAGRKGRWRTNLRRAILYLDSAETRIWLRRFDFWIRFGG